MQKLYTLTSDEVESLSFYQQSIRTTASYIGKLIDKIEDGETHTEKIKYKIDEIISYTKHINDILAEKWNDDLLWKVRNIMDKLEQAMQSEDFWIELADTSFGQVVLHGKNTNSIADNEYYEVSSEINTDGDFAITIFKTYERMKKWFDDWQGEGFYNYLVELYEKQLTQK